MRERGEQNPGEAELAGSTASKVSAIAVVGARLNSSRLPGKHLLPLAGKPLIARIFERLERVPQLDRIILATTADAYNQQLVDWAKQAGKTVYAHEGDVNDLVGRVDAVFRAYWPEYLIYICGDCPLVEPGFISRAIDAFAAAPEADYLAVAAGSGHVVIHQGVDPYRARVWQQIERISTSASEREHVGSARSRLFPSLNPLYHWEPEVFYRQHHRISVDTPSDYRFMRTLYERWYATHDQEAIVSLEWAMDEWERDPQLAAINASVHQKSVGETSAAVLLVCAVGPTVGLGHLRRCLALARALQDHYAAGVRLAIMGPAFEHPELALIPHRFFGADEAELVAYVDEKRPEAIVFDLPSSSLSVDRSQVAQWAAASIRLVGIDFCMPWPELVWLSWVPCFYLDPQKARGQEVWGWSTYLLEGPGHLRKKPLGKRVLVLSGGSDTLELGSFLPELLDGALPDETQVCWVQGPFAKAPLLPENQRLSWQVVVAPERLAVLLAETDFALCVYGVSVFECLAWGVVVSCLQRPGQLTAGERHAFAAAGLATLAERPEQAVAHLAEAMADPIGSFERAMRGQAAVDGHGPARLAARILQRPEPDALVASEGATRLL